jgi:hypothetical protein
LVPPAPGPALGVAGFKAKGKGHKAHAASKHKKHKKKKKK